MNQILFLPSKKKFKKVYRLIFILFILLFLSFSIYLFIYLYNLYKNDRIAKNLAKSFEISYLYNNNSNYVANFASTTVSSDPFVIGVLEIDSIKLHYPILSYSTVESLKVAPCRFAGPMPNEVGNLCIAGHNYLDNSFFGKVSILNTGDEIKIYDLKGNMLKYNIYYKTEILNSDFSCTSQETNGKKMVTLMTCNSLKDTRIIIVAEEKI